MNGGGAFDLLISDVDGTLVPSDKVLSPAALDAVRRLGSAGIDFTLTSARPPFGMRMVVEPLGLRLPFSGFNGGLIVDPQFNVIERHPLDPAVAAAALKLLQDSGLQTWLYTENDWLVSTDQGAQVAREAWITAMPPHLRAATADDYAQSYKLVGVCEDTGRIAAVRDQVIAQFGNAVSATSSNPHFIDITHPQANKGAFVHFMARHLGIAPARIATIGDMANDVLMFAQSGFSIAMGNALPDVQAHATVVTGSNEHDGFAAAVAQYVLAEQTR